MSLVRSAVRRVLLLALPLVAGQATAQNVLSNPDFSVNLGNWTASTGSGVYWLFDSNGMPSGGSAFGLNAQSFASIITLRQCVPVTPYVTKYNVYGAVRVAHNQGATGAAYLRWRFFGNATCSGVSSFVTHTSEIVTDSNFEWRGISETWASMTLPGAVAALIELVVQKDQATGSFAAEFDHLYFGQPIRYKGDFDADAHTDLILRQSNAANYQLWLMNGASRLGEPWNVLNVPGAPWQLVGTDDFDLDAQQDLLFWNPTTGAAQIVLMDSNIAAGTPITLPNTPGPDWTIEATADFNLDSKPDLLWRNVVTGELLVWTMDRTVQLNNIIPNPDYAPAGNWHVAGARDWNGDVRPDLLWQNADTGKLLFWFMGPGVARTSEQYAVPDGISDTNWKVVATGDYGPGSGGQNYTHDLIWRNAVTGRLVIWYMDTTGKRTSGAYLIPDSAQPDPLAWTVVGPR